MHQEPAVWRNIEYVKVSGKVRNQRWRPERFTAYNEFVRPYAAAVNSISSPEDDHASPLSAQPELRQRLLVSFMSTVATEPTPMPLPPSG